MKRAEKEANARFRACMDQTATHIRVGQGVSLDTQIVHLGTTAELHGTVCTCCPKKRRGATR